MYNRLRKFNSVHTPVLAPGLLPAPDAAPQQPVKLIRICLLALFTGLMGAIFARGIYAAFFFLGNLLYLGRFSFDSFDVYYSGVGLLMVLLPIAATALWLWLKRKARPGYQLSLIPLLATGIPWGMDGAISYFNSTWIIQVKERFKLTDKEVEILTVAVAGGAIAWCFGTPVAAVACCLELFLAEITLATILPLLIVVAMSAIFQLHPPSYDLLVSNSDEYTLLWLYGTIGIFGSLLAVLFRNVYLWLQRKSISLPPKKQWLLLAPALITGLAIWYYPEAYGPGNDLLAPLLHGGVTLRVILLICLGRFMCSLFYNSTSMIGTSVTTLLVIGAAWGLLVGFTFQVCNPHLHVSSTLIALAGMAAFLTGSTRAVLTALIFTIEMSHSAQVLPAVSIACAAAYATNCLLSLRQIRASLFAPGNEF